MAKGKPTEAAINRARDRLRIALHGKRTASRNIQAAHPMSKIWGTPLGGYTSPAAERFADVTHARLGGAGTIGVESVMREIRKELGPDVARRLRQELNPPEPPGGLIGALIGAPAKIARRLRD